MSSPGFKPSPYGTAFSVANHYTGWVRCINKNMKLILVNALVWSISDYDGQFLKKGVGAAVAEWSRYRIGAGLVKRSPKSSDIAVTTQFEEKEDCICPIEGAECWECMQYRRISPDTHVIAWKRVKSLAKLDQVHDLILSQSSTPLEGPHKDLVLKAPGSQECVGCSACQASP
ncbi:hypothetical protein TNCV_1609781 [Trichonephila clavipes]|nr:hypothetical protein TNCV_1609781 [Trichonephila clavipes]